VEDEYASSFERRVVGAKEHEELWVPAEDLAEFNGHLGGKIEVIEAFFGEDCRGHVPDELALRGTTAREQFVALAKSSPDSGFDAVCEVAANRLAVFLNFFLWEQADFSADGIVPSSRDELLSKFSRVWRVGAHGDVPLGLSRTSAMATG
jgi:hypothetical protein